MKWKGIEGLNEEGWIEKGESKKNEEEKENGKKVLNMGESEDEEEKMKRVISRIKNGLKRCEIEDIEWEGEVEIEKMKKLKEMIIKGFWMRGGILVVDGRMINVEEIEEKELKVFKIDGGKKDNDLKD